MAAEDLENTLQPEDHVPPSADSVQPKTNDIPPKVDGISPREDESQPQADNIPENSFDPDPDFVLDQAPPLVAEELRAERLAHPDAPRAPFAAGEVTLSGMVSSVLKPQDEREREKIEREVKKRQERLERTKSGKKNIFRAGLLLCIALILLAGAAVLPRALRSGRAQQWLKTALGPPAAAPKTLEIKSSEQVVFEDSFRLRLRTNMLADKATLVVVAKQPRTVPGKVIAQNGKTMTWEFYAGQLASGGYAYKVFVRNAAGDQFKELRGVFELK